MFPVRVTTASPKCEVAANSMLAVVFTAAVTVVEDINDKSTSRSSSTLVTFTVPAPVIVSPEITAASAFITTPLGTCISATSAEATTTANPVAGVKV